MTITIGKIFDLTVKKFPSKEALYDTRSQVRMTYAEWSDDVNRLANALRSEGVKKGDRVSTFLFNREELATAFFACAKLGAIFNPINFRLMSEEVAFILQDASPKVVLFEKVLEPVIARIENRFQHTSFWYTDDDVPEYAKHYKKQLSEASVRFEPEKVDETDTYAIMYTSGTTGMPKGVIHRHREMVEQSLVLIQSTKLTQHDRGLIVAPMFHCSIVQSCIVLSYLGSILGLQM
jgi:long-chain acyl-CoA synthetase